MMFDPHIKKQFRPIKSCHDYLNWSDAPTNSLKDSNVNPKVKTIGKKRIKVRSLVHNTSGVKGVCWSSRMGTRTNSQVKVQDEINLHNQKKGRLVQVEWKWCNKLNKDNLKHKFYMAHNLWEEASFPSLLKPYVPLHDDYIQMSLFLGSPKIGTFIVLKFWTFISFSN